METWTNSTMIETNNTLKEIAMDCDSVWDLLSAYADGETNAHETSLVESHVATCTDCARDLEFMRSASLALVEAPEVEPPATLRSSILAATVYRPSFSVRFANALRRTFAAQSVRYGSLAAAGAAAALTFIAMRDGGVSNGVEYHPSSRTTASAPETSSNPRALAGVVRPLGADHVSVRPNSLRPVHRSVVASFDHQASAGSLQPVIRPAIDRGTAGAIARNDYIVPDATDRDTTVRTPDAGSTANEAPRHEVIASAGTTINRPAEVPAVTPRDVETTPERPSRVLLAASSGGMDAGQVATLADLRRSLNRRDHRMSEVSGVTEGGDARVIRVDLLKSSF